MRISDWSSDVCSSDLPVDLLQILVVDAVDAQRALLHHAVGMVVFPRSVGAGPGAQLAADADVGVDEDDAVLLALVAGPGRTDGDAGRGLEVQAGPWKMHGAALGALPGFDGVDPV